MKIFSTVLIPEAKKGMEYVVTAQVDSVNPEMDSRKGPYYFIQEVRKGATKKLKKLILSKANSITMPTSSWRNIKIWFIPGTFVPLVIMKNKRNDSI